MSEERWISRVWDDGRRWTVSINTQPPRRAMLLRLRREWWADGDRSNPSRITEDVVPLPPHILEWMLKRITKHLERLPPEEPEP